MSIICTHEQIDLEDGLLAKTGILYGGNALQSITIGRNTPKNPQQAIGYLGIVDYTRGTVTSDVSLECILTENTVRATEDSGIYKYALQRLSVGLEEYVLTSFVLGLTSGNPGTLSYGYMTNSIAAALAIKAQPAAQDGEHSPFAVVLGDDGEGIKITATGGTISEVGSVSYLDPSDGTMKTMSDGGLPAGLQSLNFNGRINRDNVLDVRSILPVQFVTTYPLDISAEMELYILPTEGSLEEIGTLTIDSNSNGAGLFSAGNFLKAIGLTKEREQETVSVGRYRAFSFSYRVADLEMPIEPPPAGTLD